MGAEVILWVYGSLRRGAANHAELAGARFLGSAPSAPRYRLGQLAGYPALGPGDQAIDGEIYDVGPELLARLDHFEGCPTLYRRDVVVLADGSEALAYFAAR